jgi:hypothetical protein
MRNAAGRGGLSISTGVRWFWRCAALCLLATRRAPAQQECPLAKPGDLPLKYAGGPTVAAITACDLMTRLYAFSDDSMRGRQFGTDDDLRATGYIESELRRLKLLPGGEHGGFFQRIPLFIRALDSASTLMIDGKTFHAGTDFVVNAVGQVADIGDLAVLFAGVQNDTANLVPAGATKGKLVLMRAGPPPAPGFTQTNGYRMYQQSLAGAMIVTVAGERLPDATLKGAFAPSGPAAIRLATTPAANNPSPLTGLTVTRALADAMLGVPLAQAQKGMTGRTVSPRIRFIDTPQSVGRNVIAVLPGSDVKWRGEFIVLGAHHDHIGVNARAVDHDSLKAFNAMARPQGADGAARTLSADEWKQLRTVIDSLHRAHGGVRADSINNGADGGSGAVSLLDIAEAFAKGKTRPKRSLLFIWHGGQERGMWGSQYFATNPTVARDSIVAEINIDGVGRGGADEVTGRAADGTPLHGGEKYVQVLGARRLSAELGALADQVNHATDYGFQFDTTLDVRGHPQNMYCRTDQAMYAVWGIPVIAFTTGGHSDAHMVTDEPQYIRYDEMALLDRMIFDLATRVANLDHRLVVDHPVAPNTYVGCKQ